MTSFTIVKSHEKANTSANDTWLHNAQSYGNTYQHTKSYTPVQVQYTFIIIIILIISYRLC